MSINSLLFTLQKRGYKIEVIQRIFMFKKVSAGKAEAWTLNSLWQ